MSHLLTWGWNQNSQLGLGDQEKRIKPQAVKSLEGSFLRQVECGTRFTVLLTDKGHVMTFGRGDDHQLGHGKVSLVNVPRMVQSLEQVQVVAIAARGSHTLALSREGSCYAWGRNDEGQLGLGHREPCLNPTVVPYFTSQGIFVAQIACGRIHSAAVCSQMNLYSWGSNEEGATGHGNSHGEFVLEPKEIESLSNVTDVACGSRHTIVVCNVPEASDVTSFTTNWMYSFGWGSYGQLGLHDRQSRYEPQHVVFAGTSRSRVRIVEIACGYRHSMAVLENSVTGEKFLYSWGWNLYGQLGYDTEDGPCSAVPRLALDLPHPVHKICGGGRHTLAILEREKDGAKRLYSWGAGEDGQLGTGNAVGNKSRATRVHATGDNISCVGAGWSHSAALIESSTETVSKIGRSPSQLYLSEHSRLQQREDLHKVSRWEGIKFRLRDMASFGNVDGGFAQFLNTLILLLNVLASLRLRVGIDQGFVVGKIVPGATLTIFVSNMLFGAWADTKTTQSNEFTALPHGINTVLFFAFTMLILAPVYEKTGDAYLAYRTGLAACFMLGVLELVCLLVVDKIRALIPRAAMMSAMAGVSLTFIAMTFTLQIFANPAVAIIPLVIILVCYGSGMQLPYGMPAGMGALLVGTVIVWAANFMDIQLMDPASTPPPMDNFANKKLIYFPSTSFGAVFDGLADPDTWPYITTVVIPMLIVNIVTNLSCIEGASALGDDYSTKKALALDALVTIFGSLVGNPFPTCIYIGHGAYKAMGATCGFSYISAVSVLVLGLLNAASSLMVVVPEVAGVGILMWIGIVVTAQAFDRDDEYVEESSSTKSHAAAVALGLLPALAAWCMQYIQAVVLACSKVVSTDSSVVHVSFKEVIVSLESAGVYTYGLISLSRGYLLSSIFLSSALVEIIDRKFINAAYWMMFAAVLSFVGVVHSFELNDQGISSNYGFPARTEGDFPLKYFYSYTGAALVLFLFEMKETGRSFTRVGQKIVGYVLRWKKVTVRSKRKENKSASVDSLNEEGFPEMIGSPRLEESDKLLGAVSPVSYS